MSKWIIQILAVLALTGMLNSCSSESEIENIPTADAEMTLTLAFNTGNNADTKIGDPGTDHGENVPDWSTIGIYLIYENAPMLSFTFTKETFQTPKVYNVFAGTADVYVIALPKGQTLPTNATVQDILNLKTLDINKAQGIDKQHYMRNIFCGKQKGFQITEGSNNSVTITCKRIVAKIDLQYDVQAGIIEGNFTEAAMSAIRFNGVPQRYIFPDDATAGALQTDTKQIDELSGTISERNGRAYSYVFPGNASFNFDITYQKGNDNKKIEYNANFEQPLKLHSWYKVNLTVKGKDITATSPVNITITDNGITDQQSTQK